ncbi:Fic family protein [Acidocella sp.]|uniref:Fic family protein n=1 Tax=Acidocella sp. TaxID=50710 RepID=UPI0026058D94|nr:Fic family protein [Acidocella sp.]MDD2794644.1 Fic family protein [Acidocella sp.]
MSLDEDDASSWDVGPAQERKEADLVSNRLSELYEKPLTGKFDAAHLQAIHGYIFQDVPRHQPGVVRGDSDLWAKNRALEDRAGVYEVRYLAEGVTAKLKAILDDFGGPGALRGLSADDAATKLARLYGDLDHTHGFYEGNSRTLREFTRTLAAEAGFSLDWTGTNVTAEHRNALYAARDVEVLSRHYPGVTPENAGTRDAYEAALQVESFRKGLGDQPLRDLIRAALTESRTLTPAQEQRPKADTAESYWAGVARKGQGGDAGSPDATIEQDAAKQATRGPRLK